MLHIDTKYYKKDDTYYRVDIVPDDIGDIYSYDEGLNLHFYDARERSLLERYPDTLGELIEECRGTFNEEALQAFAEELADKIKGGWFDFDVCVATPDMMGVVGRLGKLLGPKGLMPNPKVGTVTMDVTSAVNEIKAGKIEYRTDKAGNVQTSIGKVSFDADKLLDNYITLISTLIKVKPSGAKGQYIKSVTLSTTMGPGVHIDVLKADSNK